VALVCKWNFVEFGGKVVCSKCTLVIDVLLEHCEALGRNREV
jgi:hypothetical protein